MHITTKSALEQVYIVQVKRTEAAAFVETIKGPQWGGEESTVAVNVDPGMLAAMQRAALVSPAWLAACSATMGTSLTGMAVLAANNVTMQVSRNCRRKSQPRLNTGVIAKALLIWRRCLCCSLLSCHTAQAYMTG